MVVLLRRGVGNDVKAHDDAPERRSVDYNRTLSVLYAGDAIPSRADLGQHIVRCILRSRADPDSGRVIWNAGYRMRLRIGTDTSPDAGTIAGISH